MLARGELQTIGATTLDEYRKHLEKDAALERRFQPIQVGEPTVAHTIEILKGLRDRYEAHHRVSITDARAGRRGQPGRPLHLRPVPARQGDRPDRRGRLADAHPPDDRAAGPARVRRADRRRAPREGVRDRRAGLREGRVAARQGEDAARPRRPQREKEWKAGDLDVVAEVDDEQIAEVLATWTGIPVFKLTEEETARLLRMEDELHKRVIGQEQAIKAVSQAIRRTRAGLKDPKRPGGSFIFAGPSGVGKTELSKTLAEFLFGDEDALIQLDMSEFHDQYTVSRLVGAPPGYVGYDEGGQLTEKVRRKPFSVVLFDEVEKAHPDVFNTLLQMLEDGRLTDGQGRIVDFKNTVLILTTNLGTRDVVQGGRRSASPAANDDRVELRADEAQGQRRAQAALPAGVPQPHRRHHRVPPADARRRSSQIVDLMIARVDAQLQNKDMGLELTADGQGAAGQEGLRPGARCPAAAPHDPARDRGRAVREDPVRRADRRPDRGRRRRARATTARTAEKFTFRGEAKPSALVPDVPPAGISAD